MDWWTYIMQTEQQDKETRTVCPWHEIIIHTLMFIECDWESQIKSLPKSKLTWAVGGHKQVCDSHSAGRVWLGTFDANCVLPSLLEIQHQIYPTTRATASLNKPSLYIKDDFYCI